MGRATICSGRLVNSISVWANALDAMGYNARTSDPPYKHIPFYISCQPDNGVVFGLFYYAVSDGFFDFVLEHSNYCGPYLDFATDHGDLDIYTLAGPDLADGGPPLHLADGPTGGNA